MSSTSKWIVWLGVLLAAGAGYMYYLQKKRKKSQEQMMPLSEEDIPIEYQIPTQIVYYPEDDIPDILQKPSDVTPYHPYYGCPQGYTVETIWSQGGGMEVPGMPGALNEQLYCRKIAPFMREDVLRYPLSVYNLEDPAGGSSALLQWAARHTVLSNFMAGLDNTMNYRSLDIPTSFNFQDIGTGNKTFQYGGTGYVPTPYQLPVYI